MSDHLYLSYWLRSYSAINMLRHFQKMLDRFPFLPATPGPSTLRIEAVSASEPPILERALVEPVQPLAVVELASEFLHPDCAYVLDTWWGLWQHERTWNLQPARVSLYCFGPEYEDSPREHAGASAEHLRIDFGLESWFLPDVSIEESVYYAKSNLTALLRLTHDLDNTLAVERRQLWTDSGENFADKVREATQDSGAAGKI